jgi:hypothetical protein
MVTAFESERYADKATRSRLVIQDGKRIRAIAQPGLEQKAAAAVAAVESDTVASPATKRGMKAAILRGMLRQMGSGNQGEGVQVAVTWTSRGVRKHATMALGDMRKVLVRCRDLVYGDHAARPRAGFTVGLVEDTAEARRGAIHQPRRRRSPDDGGSERRPRPEDSLADARMNGYLAP